MQPKGIMPIQEAIDLRDVLRLIGMKELTNNVFSLPNKKKKANEASAWFLRVIKNPVFKHTKKGTNQAYDRICTLLIVLAVCMWLFFNLAAFLTYFW